MGHRYVKNGLDKTVNGTVRQFENVVSQLEGSKFFSGLDLTSIFYQQRIREEDIEKTAFRTQQEIMLTSSRQWVQLAVWTQQS